MPDPFDVASSNRMDVPTMVHNSVRSASRHISKFQIIPAVLALKNEKASVMKLYWWIGHFGRGSAEGCWASVNTLAEMCGRDKHRVQEDLARLRELGLIRQVGVGLRGTNCWALVPHDELPVPTLDDVIGGSRVSPRSKRKRQAAEVTPEGTSAVQPRDNQGWQERTPTGVESASPSGVESASKQKHLSTRTHNNNPQQPYRDNTADAVLPTHGDEEGKAEQTACRVMTHRTVTAAQALLRLATDLKAVKLTNLLDEVHWKRPTKALKEALQASADRGDLEGAIEAVVRGLVWAGLMGSPARNQVLLVDWIGRGSSGIDALWAEKTVGPTGDPMGERTEEVIDELLDGSDLIRWSGEEGYVVDSRRMAMLLDAFLNGGYPVAGKHYAVDDEPIDVGVLRIPSERFMGEYLVDPEEDIDVA